MTHRNLKRALFFGAAACLVLFVVPMILLAAARQNDVLFGAMILVGLPCIGVCALLHISSLALNPEYGLFGSKNLGTVPYSLKSASPLIASGRIGSNYYARGCLIVRCSAEGIAITVASGDMVFIDARQIERITPGWFWSEIVHHDPQIRSPIVVNAGACDCIQRALNRRSDGCGSPTPIDN